MLKLFSKYFLISICSLLTFFVVCYVNISIQKPVFNTPDEASNYILVDNFYKYHSFVLPNEYIDIDYGNNLHPRGFINQKGKTVPFNFLGTAVFYSPIYLIFKDFTKYINYIFLLILIYSIKKTLDIFHPNSRTHFASAFIGILASPWILYYFNFPYFNIVGATTFFSASFYNLIKFNYRGNVRNLYWYVFFASLSVWFAYHFSIFYVFLLLSNYLADRVTYSRIVRFKTLGIMASIVLFTFVFPLLLINKELYGSGLIYGYSLFTKFYFGSERTGNIISSLKTVLFPSQDFNLDIFWTNIKTTTFYVSPLIFILLIKVIPRFKKIIYYIPLLIWFIGYNGMGESYLSGNDVISLDKSVIRYWLPAFYLLSLAYSYYLSTVKESHIKLATMLVIMLTSFFILFNSLNISKRSLIMYQDQINKQYGLGMIRKNDYVLSSLQDKYLFNIGKTITWWPSHEGDDFFDPTQIGKIIQQLLIDNQFVYAFRSERLSNDKISALENYNLNFLPISDNLFRITPR